jgi:hypothetical protein
MKRNQLTGTVLAVLLSSTPALAQKAKKTGYAFPSAMAEDVRKEYIKLCEKGQVLYGLSCGRCHNMKNERGKWVIPDFTAGQINGYEIRMGNKQHEGALTENDVNAEELNLITTFLMFKKKSGVIPVFPDKKQPQ